MRWQLCIIALLCCGMVIRAASAGIVPNEPPMQVLLTPQDAGGYLIATPDYKARVNADGNLHSLIVNGVELLDDRVAGSAGSAFFVEHPLALPTVTVKDRTITASDGTFTVNYEFDEGYITLHLKQTSSNSAAYVTFCYPRCPLSRISAMSRHCRIWPRCPPITIGRMCEVETAGGEYLQLRHGSRIWGRDLGRQVWELE